MTETLWSEPARLVAGDTWAWKKALSDYPASTWVLSYALRCAAGYVNITASADGDNHSVSVAAATTAVYAAGRYYWQSYVTSGSTRYTVAEGVLEVEGNYAATSAAADKRTHARKMLEAIEAVLEGVATSDVLEYSIGGRSLKRMSRQDLIKLHAYYKGQVGAEEGTGNLGRSLGVTFSV